MFIITASLSQYPNNKVPTSDQIQPFENHGTGTVSFDDMLLSKQASNIDLFFTRGRHQNIDIYYISQSYFHVPENTVRIKSNIYILIKQTLRDIMQLFHDIAGSYMNLKDWKQLSRNAWENDFDYLQKDRFDEKGEDRYIIKNALKLLIQNAPLKRSLFKDDKCCIQFKKKEKICKL